MNTTVDPGRPAAPRIGPVVLWLLVGAVGLATTLVGVIGGTSPVFAAAPVLGIALLVALARAPLRASVSVLLFLVLALDVPTDAAGLWHTPLVSIGAWLGGPVDAWVPGLKLSGLEVVVLFLLAVDVHRRARSPGVTRDEAPVARVVRDFLLLYLLGFLFAEANGMLRGLGPAPWKIRNLLQVPLLFVLFQSAYRHPSDGRVIGRVVVAAATVKALFAIWVQYGVAPSTGGPLDFATNHGDSVLFAVAAFVLLASFAEIPDRTRLARVVLLLPIILLGMVANGRRIVWVMLGMTLLSLYLLSPWRSWKRRWTRAILLLLPIIAAYVAVGWSSGSSFFAPLRIFRTVSDGSVDASTLWREIENWNIAMSIRQSPVAGIGLGGEYTPHMHAGDVSAFYPEYRAWPHNSILGLILLAGFVGFSAMWLLHAVVVFLSARSYRVARDAHERVEALTCIATTIACMALAYGDLGANFVQYRVFWALALAVSGRLAVATGAWPAGAAPLPPPGSAVAREPAPSPRRALPG